MIETKTIFRNPFPGTVTDLEKFITILRANWARMDWFFEYRKHKYFDTGIIQKKEHSTSREEITFYTGFVDENGMNEYFSDPVVKELGDVMERLGFNFVRREVSGVPISFSQIDISDTHRVLDVPLDMDLLRWDYKRKEPYIFENWAGSQYEGDLRPRYYVTEVADEVIEHMQGFFNIEFRNNQISWFCVPSRSVGAYHFDTIANRDSAINVDMKLDTGSGLFYFQNPPHKPGDVVKINYPDDKPILLNVKDYGHMILNESEAHRIILTISLTLDYKDVIEMLDSDRLYTDKAKSG